MKRRSRKLSLEQLAIIAIQRHLKCGIRDHLMEQDAYLCNQAQAHILAKAISASINLIIRIDYAASLIWL